MGYKVAEAFELIRVLLKLCLYFNVSYREIYSSVHLCDHINSIEVSCLTMLSVGLKAVKTSNVYGLIMPFSLPDLPIHFIPTHFHSDNTTTISSILSAWPTIWQLNFGMQDQQYSRKENSLTKRIWCDPVL